MKFFAAEHHNALILEYLQRIKISVHSYKYISAKFNSEADLHTIYPLAHNMGTSVSILRTFYGQNRMPGQAAELTKLGNFNSTAKPILQRLDNLQLVHFCYKASNIPFTFNMRIL